LYNILIEFSILVKLIRLIKMCKMKRVLESSRQISGTLPIENCLKKGDALEFFFFKLILL